MKDTKNIFGGALKLSVVTGGTKGTKDTEAGIQVGPTLNKFDLNSLASAEMKLEHGDKIIMFANDEAEDANSRFFICKSPVDFGAVCASDDSKPGFGKDISYSNSGIWSQILQVATGGDVFAVAIAPEKMRQTKLIVDKSSTVKVYAKLESIGVQELPFETEDGAIVTAEVYRLFDLVTTPHTPKVFAKRGDKVESAE